MTISRFIKDLSANLARLYDANEAKSIAEILVCDILKLSRTNMLINSDNELENPDIALLQEKALRLTMGEPVQYITQNAEFYGLNFYVDSNVLIPRQETEILVDTICKTTANTPINILDIGCGSGCISITIKKILTEANVFAVDISPKALEITNKNANSNKADVKTAKYDILSCENFPFDEKFDIVISNPPYVLNSEKKLMHWNVTEYEPNIALYVDDCDPLVFYRKIIEFIDRHQPNYPTKVYLEINERFGKEMTELCESFSYNNTNIIKDLNGKNRFIETTRNF